MPQQPAFRFIDLFAGIGGFHAVMKAFGGECVYAVEIDKKAANVYEANWGHPAHGDITLDADDELGIMNVPAHDVLCAGFPCQPFSKSGAQRGMDEARGTLFFNIASIIKAHHPAVVLLENVRNLIGPRHAHEWDVIIQTLREEGYNVSARPAVFSPHLLPEHLGGTPQVRERVFITATYAPQTVPYLPNGKVDFEVEGPRPVANMTDRFPAKETSNAPLFDPGSKDNGWNLLDGSILTDSHRVPGCDLTPVETLWIDAWDDFTLLMRERTGEPLKGFPYWADCWLDFPEAAAAMRRAPVPTRDDEGRYQPTSAADFKMPKKVTRPAIPSHLPAWKQSHLRRNYDMFEAHWRDVLPWAWRWGIYTDLFPASRRKAEWQAQDAKRLWDTVMHFRPSGIRAKRPTYLPALVAITQTSIVGPLERRLSPRETARLQGLPDTFVFPNQPDAATYKQMGNGVAVGAVQHVFREHVLRDEALLMADPAGVGPRIVAAAKDTTPAKVVQRLAEHKPACS
ncbi:DNA cytosine methyltransferase [Nocardioides jiangxiensis]|uniref:Cytosine-specific methyltransferase n=1 Tax=Nocardioides jiangxiensis TaxID=3064524 RepID=A0ABT9B001_9ACTN|nr:DNA cytosine methyltransferase [Nocardioides sp. WY-20]MDO7868174.1 DNA cytosine methyltransferase [Nocardioides sp. WY-20]